MKKLLLTLLVLSSSLIALKAQNIYTIAGNGNAGFGGDGYSATSMYTEFYNPYDVFIDKLGNIYIADTYNNRIREINTSGIVSTVAGEGTLGYGGDGGPATAAYLNYPHGVYVDNSENIYISDIGNNAIRKVDASGTISTIAGMGREGYSGDGGPATDAELYNPWSVCMDDTGNIYIADERNQRIRKINTSGIISTYGGNGYNSLSGGYSGDGGPATAAELSDPIFLFMEGGNMLVADYGNQRIRQINSSGIISTVAGNGYRGGGFSGDGGPATAAELGGPFAVCKDSYGNMYISDNGNYRIRKVDTSGIITTIAGIGSAGYTGDGGPATAAECMPVGICTGMNGNVYEADVFDVIREVVINPTGIENVKSTISELILFPNPTNKFLYINTERLQPGLATLSIMDITGRKVMSTAYNTNNSMQLDVSFLTPGMYFLNILNKDINVTQKFIKQ